MVRVHKLHPFKLWFMNSGRTEQEAADLLGISRTYLSRVLNRRAKASRELYEDMVRVSRNGVTLNELEAYEKASDRARRINPKPHRTAR